MCFSLQFSGLLAARRGWLNRIGWARKAGQLKANRGMCFSLQLSGLLAARMGWLSRIRGPGRQDE